MRFVSLLVTLLVLAWVVLQQLGSGSGSTATHGSTGSANAAIQAENRAKAVEGQVLQAAKQQADALSRAETPGQVEQSP